MPDDEAARRSGAPVPTSTAALLERVRRGDAGARDRLAARYIETLRRLARGRLPRAARSRYETDELVQDTVLRGLDRVGRFEPRRTGAFLAYLRRILLNLIYDECRRAARRPGVTEIPEGLRDLRPTPLTGLISREARARYEAALAELPEGQREAVVLRLEGHSFDEIARKTGRPSADAARMQVNRGMRRLGEIMKEMGAEA